MLIYLSTFIFHILRVPVNLPLIMPTELMYTVQMLINSKYNVDILV